MRLLMCHSAADIDSQNSVPLTFPFVALFSEASQILYSCWDGGCNHFGNQSVMARQHCPGKHGSVSHVTFSSQILVMTNIDSVTGSNFTNHTPLSTPNLMPQKMFEPTIFGLGRGSELIRGRHGPMSIYFCLGELARNMGSSGLVRDLPE